MKNRKMSDQIKTQHGTIGLLMAECEQLRRDLAQAKKIWMELDARYGALDKELAQAKAELEKAKVEHENCKFLWANVLADLDQAKAESSRLVAASNLPTMHACERCGMPGAVLHFPGGYLCPNGCNTNPLNLKEEKKDVYE